MWAKTWNKTHMSCRLSPSALHAGAMWLHLRAGDSQLLAHPEAILLSENLASHSRTQLSETGTLIPTKCTFCLSQF